jgi:hypothetical protein
MLRRGARGQGGLRWRPPSGFNPKTAWFRPCRSQERRRRCHLSRATHLVPLPRPRPLGPPLATAPRLSLGVEASGKGPRELGPVGPEPAARARQADADASASRDGQRRRGIRRPGGQGGRRQLRRQPQRREEPGLGHRPQDPAPAPAAVTHQHLKPESATSARPGARSRAGRVGGIGRRREPGRDRGGWGVSGRGRLCGRGLPRTGEMEDVPQRGLFLRGEVHDERPAISRGSRR